MKQTMEKQNVELASGVIRFLQLCSALCAQLLRESITKEKLDSLRAARELFLEEPFCSLAPRSANRLHDILSEDADKELLSDLRKDYTYLFIVVAQSQVSPYESVYRTMDNTLFGPSTLKLRKLMREFGLGLPQDISEPDDHIAIEFAFLAELLSRLADSCEGIVPGSKDSEVMVDGIKRLLAEHLLGFAPMYLERLAQRSRTIFYQELAYFALATLRATGKYFAVKAEYEVMWN